MHDMHMLRIAAKLNIMSSIKDAWLGQMLNVSHRLLIKAEPDTLEQGWLFPLLSFQDSVILVWPAVEHSFEDQGTGARGLFCLPMEEARDISELFVVCFDPARWRAKRFRWRSPRWLLARFPRASQQQMPADRVVAFPESPEESLLACAARAAFWGLGKVFLGNLAKHLNCELPSGSTMFQTVLRLVAHICNTDGQSTLDIVGKRLGYTKLPEAGMEQLLEGDAVHWCFDVSDHDEITRSLKAGVAEAQAQGDFLLEYTVKRQEVSLRLASENVGPVVKKRKTHRKPSLPEGGFSQSDAKLFVPPGSSIWRSSVDMGWCGHRPPYRRTHFSGLLHGQRQAYLMQIRDLWAKHLDFTGTTRASCPFPQLWGCVEVVARRPPGAAASSSG